MVVDISYTSKSGSYGNDWTITTDTSQGGEAQAKIRNKFDPNFTDKYSSGFAPSGSEGILKNYVANDVNDFIKQGKIEILGSVAELTPLLDNDTIRAAQFHENANSIGNFINGNLFAGGDPKNDIDKDVEEQVTKCMVKELSKK